LLSKSAITKVNDQIKPTERTQLRRLPRRGLFDRETIYKILDEGFVCHVGFTMGAKTFVIPTGYARVGDRLLIHGSSASRMLQAMSDGIEVCVTVTLIDGLVLARSAFHHSVNYRSVVVFGTASLVTGEGEKIEALRAFTEHIVPGRWQDVRPPNKGELAATAVLSLPIQEASAKIRTGDPVDAEEDYALDVWAGVIPLKFCADTPRNDARLKDGINPPRYLVNQTEPKNHINKRNTESL
jgi:nitroimidazol reductase NimA-like FMN-containing flavoprotein (pyridoxamine 5'-phosphate oxidase superfamily)